MVDEQGGVMSFHLEVLGERFTFSEVDIPAAIRGLREALGKSEESMARIIGCSLPAYQKSELGSLVPNAEWLVRMLQLCPDEETRDAFRIRPERRSAGRPKQVHKVPLDAAERQRFRNIARQAIDTIFECGQAGYEASDMRLVDFATSLRDAATYYQQVLEGKKRSRNKPAPLSSTGEPG